MFFSIYFCADGILRAEQHPDKPLIPLNFIQQHSNVDNDFEFWVQWWKKNVYFEKGLTISSFFSCLEPWKDFFSTLTNVDIDSYIKEIRKPCPLEKQTFAYVEISSETIIDPELSHMEQLNVEDILKEINGKTKQKRLMQLTGLWHKNHRLMINGFKDTEKDINQRYAFNMSHPEYFANTLLVLNNQKQVSFFNDSINRYMEKEVDIFNQEMPCLIKNSSNSVTLIYEENFSFREIIEQFFSELKPTPEEMREFDQILYQRFVDMDKYQKNKQEESKANSDKVVSIFKNQEEDKDLPKNKEKGVHIAMTTSFLNDLNRLGLDEVDFWDSLLEKASHDNTILKIGKVEKQQVPYIRLFGRIISEDNYIKPTDPKLL